MRIQFVQNLNKLQDQLYQSDFDRLMATIDVKEDKQIRYYKKVIYMGVAPG